MAVPILLDCDPGHDDAMAILLAAASLAIDLLGITTVAGNQTLLKTTLNAGRQANARVAVGLDADRFWELVVAAVAALGLAQQLDQVLPDLGGARIRPELGVAVDGRRARVRVLDEDDGILARLVDVGLQVGVG